MENNSAIIKSWGYEEKSGNQTVAHTISVTKNRFTHQAEERGATCSLVERTDVDIKNVCRVRTVFGRTRNLLLVVLGIVLGVAFFAISIINFVNYGEVAGLKDASTPLLAGVLFLLLCLGCCALAIYFYLNVKPGFSIELDLKSSAGKCAIKQGATTAFIAKKASGFKLYMPAKVGVEIVQTLGTLMIEE